ncbi:hypothetical protein GH839_27830 [Bacillus thuringiensis]|nr:hypothetical protein [Bacillus thuringiensis]MRB24634.1 hypothetical protein [Bacillus thuringiensis]MRB43227.1 hypothetical protein [Bacillus thuringiensis]MRB49329.1 hypothetical protein [Bacillus thuringiensis]MRB55664.1 hypothetical protein [Bacillus thuringiensis]
MNKFYAERLSETDRQLEVFEEKLRKEYGVPDEFITDLSILSIRMILLQIIVDNSDPKEMINALDIFEVKHQLDKLGLGED